MLALELANQIFLGTFRQVAGHFAFGAPDDERTDASRKSPARQRVRSLVEVPRKRRFLAQHSRHAKVHDAPEIEQPVFDRRAAEGQSMVGAQERGALGGLRLRILDVLRFVQDRRMPGEVRKRLDGAKLRVVDHQ